MNIANVKVNGVEAVVDQLSPIPAGIVGATVSFQYDDGIWSTLRKTVVFRSVVVRDVVDAGELVTVPPEVVAEGYITLRVGVYGVDAQGTVVIPTLWAELGQVLPAADPSGDPSADPELPVWAQIQARIGDTDNLETENKSSLVGAVNAVCNELAEKADLTELQEVNEATKKAQAIAKGRATGYVFDTVEDLDVWLAEPDHVAELVVGDNFYIRTLDVPDYWWDGAQKQPLETQKVDLSEYVKNTEYGNAQRPGVVKVAGYDTGNYGFIKANQKTNPGAFLICRASDADLDAKENYHKPVVPRNLDYAVKRGVAYNELVMTDTEKAAACQWLGTIRVIENADGSVTAIMPSGKSRTLDLSKIEWILG